MAEDKEENMIQLDSGMEEETEIEIPGDDSDDSVEVAEVPMFKVAELSNAVVTKTVASKI